MKTFTCLIYLLISLGFKKKNFFLQMITAVLLWNLVRKMDWEITSMQISSKLKRPIGDTFSHRLEFFLNMNTYFGFHLNLTE